MILSFIILLFFHWVGDFILQKHEWSIAKSSSNVALTKHVAVYSAVIAIGFQLAAFSIARQEQWTVSDYAVTALLFGLVNGVAHWIIDYFTSRQTKRLYAEEKIHDFFVVIGFDQFLHYVVMLVSFGVMTHVLFL